MKKIYLIFPNQLFKIERQFNETNNIALIEDSLFFGCDYEWKNKFHCQKIIFHKASMYAYEEDLKKKGYDVIYLKHKRGNRTENDLNYLTKKGFNHFISFDSFDYLLEKRIKTFCLEKNCTLEIFRNELSITNLDISEATI